MEARLRRTLSPATVAALCAALAAGAAVLLLAMGRTPWCECGTLRLWSGDAWGPENSQHLLDPYTFTHLTHGVLFYALLRLAAGRLGIGARLVVAVALEAGWEVLENTDAVIDRYRAATMALGYYGDSVVNSVGDIAACAAGFLLASRLPTRVTIFGVVALEAALALWIRDGLLLNVVMLVHPIEAVKRWQAGA